MSEILSQDEINALLSAYESANTSSATEMVGGHNKVVRLYDFTRPDKFSKDHLRTLNTIHSNFSTALASTLSVLYQMPTKVNFIGLDQVTYKEYQASIPSKTLLAEVALEPLSSYILFELNPSIIGVWVDFLCGGNPQLQSKPSELTPIDVTVAKRILTTCLQTYADSWSGIVAATPDLKLATDSESYEQVLLPAETVLVCSLEIHTGESVGMMTICIPALGVESVLPKLSAARMARASRQHDGATSAQLQRLIAPSNVLCRVVLGGTKIPFSEAMELKVGDVIKTDRNASSEIELWIGNNRLFDCRPGTNGGNLAVVISGAATDIPEDDDLGILLPEEEPIAA